ncbi:MFS family permease [Catenulispora sp. GP43]|uniref:MFS transporter n=1 Tax=Catenulispora sp. GP43 TaxID=3156263 RepID=UPI0035116F43
MTEPVTAGGADAVAEVRADSGTDLGEAQAQPQTRPQSQPQPGRPPGLWRNRDFNLLWGGQCLSDLGTAMSDLALPLLVLQLTGSPTRAGLVGTVGLTIATACRLPAGVLADRFDRRRLLIVCDAIRLAGYAALAWAVMAKAATLPVILAVVVAGAAATAVFSTTEFAAVRALVSPDHIVTAVARNEARSYGTSLAGPPLGGLLFGLGRALPFLGNTLSYGFSLVAVVCIRRPLQQARPEPMPEPADASDADADADANDTSVGVGDDVAVAVAGGRSGWQGLRFVAANPFLRALIAIATPLNMAFTGMIFALTLELRRAGQPPALIGLATAIIGVGGLLGAFLAPALQRRLRLPTLIRLICWSTAALMTVSVLLAPGIGAAAPLAAAVFLGPSANAALFGYQAAVTPDHLQGRVVSVILLAATSAAALAPATAGFLLAHIAGHAALLAFPILVAVAAGVATVSGGIRYIAAQ